LEVVVEKQKISSERTLETIIKDLPPELQQEVADFAHFLWQTKIKREKKKLSLTWAGGLKEFRHQYKSMDLQKKALEWWGD
jgi:hypothetical protein